MNICKTWPSILLNYKAKHIVYIFKKKPKHLEIIQFFLIVTEEKNKIWDICIYILLRTSAVVDKKE